MFDISGLHLIAFTGTIIYLVAGIIRISRFISRFIGHHRARARREAAEIIAATRWDKNYRNAQLEQDAQSKRCLPGSTRGTYKAS